ncbi:endonuclease III [Candidatus Methylomirabilis lanthanidiphila]|uniref:Endonuclease III n=1 Tax=Candidatus Methylomirabilis lanthanidiphila TaxID=2211376 RepID=A0A564ZP13_9BACT|nr:endonuclease III [Candidatus Methylomirabilis lanthanidiphila]VUZ86587.1 endonuclease III [Candidatus Methylomirabilis lanthanidiphila]
MVTLRAAKGDIRTATPATANKILAILEHTYPDAHVTLDFKNPFELLIATIMAAQCTDERVNQVTKGLFKRYSTPKAFAEADPVELEDAIRSTGFYRNKARSIIGCCKKIMEEFGGQVPQTMEELITLPGVWRKTANIVLSNALGITAGIAVDTHVIRVANRLGLAQSDKPDEIEQQLCRIIPEKQWTRLTHLLVFHGRAVCMAKRPDCPRCPVLHLCPWPDKTA